MDVFGSPPNGLEKENGAPKSKTCQTADERFRHFEHQALGVAHAKNAGQLGPPDNSTCIHTEGATGQMCGDSNVAEKWINYIVLSTNREILACSENVAFLVGEKGCVSRHPDRRLCEAHFREHNQDADHLATWTRKAEEDHC